MFNSNSNQLSDVPFGTSNTDISKGAFVWVANIYYSRQRSVRIGQNRDNFHVFNVYIVYSIKIIYYTSVHYYYYTKMSKQEESEENWVEAMDNLCSKLNVDPLAGQTSKLSFAEIKRNYTLDVSILQ